MARCVSVLQRLHTHHSVPSVFVYVCVCLMLLPAGMCQESVLTFTQPEEQRIGHLVGSVSGYVGSLNAVAVGDRSSLRYAILPDASGLSNLFSIDEISGNMSFAKRVDREAVCPRSDTCEVRFRVAISGKDNIFITIPIKIIIMDINDNSPAFPEPGQMVIHLSEAAAVNTTNVLMSATDADSSPPFGVLSYALEPASDTFQVVVTRNFVGTSHVSLQLRQKLDREFQDKYSLLVVAKDGGDPSKSGSLVVNIVVDDVNDNDPTFTKEIYSANFSEEAEPGYVIITVEATDADINNNGKIVYELNSALSGNSADVQNKIKVDNSTGVVTLKETISSGEYRFVIDARDMGNNPRSDQAVLRITVLDTVNNPPVVRINPVKMDALPVGWVSEGSRVSSVVAVLNVEDNDEGKNGSVVCESLERSFSLQLMETKRYKLVVARSLDREANETYRVEIVCRDEGVPSLNATTTFAINIFDINDNSPVFSKNSYTQEIPENNLVDSTVLIVSASDIDQGENAVVEYQLRGEESNFRIIADSGVIKASQRFDREKTGVYKFQVLAIDRGSPSLTATAAVTIVIGDLNDVAPRFSQDSYKFQIYENKNSGSIVGNVTASDPDLGNGGVTSLILRSDNETVDIPFAIDDEGFLSSLSKLDREDQNSYHFYIVASDQGRPRLSSSAEITVQILDVNDNRPTFIFPSDNNFTSFVNLPVSQDSSILRVDVNDSDENNNAFLTYTISSSNASNLFRIGLFDGKIYTNTDLGNTNSGVYFLTINVTDQGVPQLWDARTLYLVVQTTYGYSDDDEALNLRVLIVACIVCVTVIVSGVILMVICMVRKHDKQASLQGKEAIFCDKHLDGDSGCTKGESHRQLSETTKRHAMKPELTYHQMSLELENTDYYDKMDGRKPSDATGQKPNPTDGFASSVTSGSPRSLPVQCQQVMGLKSKPEDFHSTSSNETATTGDSGHGSDEDMSTSVEHAATPAVCMEHTAPVDRPALWSRLNPNSGKSASASPQHYLVQPPGRTLHTATRLTSSMAGKQPHRLPDKSYSKKNYNNNRSGNRDPNSAQRSRPVPSPTPYPNSHHHQSIIHRPQLSRQTIPHANPGLQQADNLALQRPGQKRISFVSQASFDDGDSDLNTTTSGSYSVASEDQDRLYNLTDARCTDMYV